MKMIVLIATMILAGGGMFLLAEFAWWRVKGRLQRAEIAGFSKRRYLWMRLPVLTFEKDGGESEMVPVERIGSLSYATGRPVKGGTVTAIVLEGGEKPRVRVYGYMDLVAALFLIAPLPAVAGWFAANSLVVAQAFYVLIFAVIVIGGWLVLKMIQKMD